MGGVMQRGTLFYDKKVTATLENEQEKMKEYIDALNNEPTPSDYPNHNIVIKNKFEMTGKTINLMDGVNLEELAKLARELQEAEESEAHNNSGMKLKF